MTKHRRLLLLPVLFALSAGCAAAAPDPRAAPAREVRTPLSDREFFGKLDLDRPGLEPVRAAVDSGDPEQARSALAEYYRHRSGVFHPFDPENPIPESLSRGRFERAARPLVERTGDFAPEYWRDDGFYDFEASGIRFKERMYYLEGFGRAAAAEEGERTAEALVTLIRSFIDQYHSPEGRGQGMWFSMNTGIRMRTGWPVAFLALLDSPRFTDDDLILFLKSVWDQTDHLRHHHSETSNWLTFEMAGLYTSGVVYPEFKDAPEWRRVATETAVADLERGWLPDGMTIELSPAYGRYFSNYFVIYDLAEHVGRLGEFNIRDLHAKTESIFEVYLKIMAPDRLAPATNNNRPAPVIEILDSGLERFPDREDIRWAVSDGEHGTPPDDTSLVLPYAGFAAMRSGWERGAHMLYFDFGPVGYRHAHQDGLNIMLWAYGRQVLFDPGLVGYEYDDPFVNYAVDTFSHNTVLVDNRPQRRAWYDNPHPRRMPYRELEDFRWETTLAHDFAAGVYDEAYGMPGVSNAYPYSDGSNFGEGWEYPTVHYRRVYYHKPDVFLVADTLVAKDNDAHDYDLRWHLDSTKLVAGQDGLGQATADDGKPNLEVVPLLTDNLEVTATSAQEDPEILGWRVARSDSPQPATTVQHRRNGPGTVQFLTLLLPLEPGKSTRLAASQQTGSASAAFELDDGRRFIVDIPGEFWEKLTVTRE